MRNHSDAEVKYALHAVPRKRPGRPEPFLPAAAAMGRLPRITQVLALAVHFQDMITRAEARNCADLARLGCLTRERISQVMKLLWLAPDIQMEILYLRPTPGGKFPVNEFAVRKIANTLSWAEQHAQWAELKKIHKLGEVTPGFPQD